MLHTLNPVQILASSKCSRLQYQFSTTQYILWIFHCRLPDSFDPIFWLYQKNQSCPSDRLLATLFYLTRLMGKGFWNQVPWPSHIPSLHYQVVVKQGKHHLTSNSF